MPERATLNPSLSLRLRMQTFEGRNATKPCLDCLITWMQAGLTYPNGLMAISQEPDWRMELNIQDVNITLTDYTTSANINRLLKNCEPTSFGFTTAP